MICVITNLECHLWRDGECLSVTGADCPGNSYEDVRACVEALAIRMVMDGVNT